MSTATKAARTRKKKTLKLTDSDVIAAGGILDCLYDEIDAFAHALVERGGDFEATPVELDERRYPDYERAMLNEAFGTFTRNMEAGVKKVAALYYRA